MSISKFTALSAAFAILALAFVSGCGETQAVPAADQQLVTKHRSSLVMDAEPGSIMGITELREKLEGTGTSEESHDHEGHDHDEHAGHDHGEHAHDHEGHDHDEHAGHDHGEHAHDHEGHDHDEHAGHDHGEHAHDHEGHDHDEHAGHDHGEHGHDHVGHDHDAHAGHDHGDHGHGDDSDHDHGASEHQHTHADGTTCTDPDCDHDHGSSEYVEGLGSMDDIVVVGKISKETTEGGASASDFPWESGKAMFVMVDPSIEGGEEEHQHKEGEECPFCAKKKIQGQAVVQFTEEGSVIDVDVRQLFDLEVDDIVVVRGDAELIGGVLMISADGIYVR